MGLIMNTNTKLIVDIDVITRASCLFDNNNPSKLKEMCEWLMNNCTNGWSVGPGSSNTYHSFYFVEESDYMMFKLRWM